MNKFSAHRIQTSEFIEILHLWHTHPRQGELQRELPCSSSRACDAPSPAAARPSPASLRPACPSVRFSAEDGALDDLKPWTGLHQPPHQPEVAPRQGLSRPQ